MSDRSTLSVTHVERDDGPSHLRWRRFHYVVTTAVLLALAVAVVVDAFAPVFGVDAEVVEDRTADGALLRVEYPEVTRPALASPFSIEVTDPDGFTAPIEIAVSRPFIEIWDENGFYPTPSSETGDDSWVVWEFEPPDGAIFR
ncbi:MAG: hypothetical protein ACRDJP_11850, partial [Actinomycetota bacterium]